MRIQLALNVRDIDEAIGYYGKLFNAEPHKRRPGYANFAIDEPPLKLVLFENPHAPERINHLGVEVFDAAQVRAAGARLEAANILAETEEQAVCCHAEQTKVWSDEPQGLRWEWYAITDDAPEVVEAPASCDGQLAIPAALTAAAPAEAAPGACCGSSAEVSAPACCDV